MKNIILVLLLTPIILFGQKKYESKITSYLKKGEYEEALTYISTEKAKLLYQKNLSKAYSDIITLHRIEGELYLKQHKLIKAEKAFGDGESYFTKKLTQFPKKINAQDIDILDNYADLNLEIGDFLKAGELLMTSDSLRLTHGKKKDNKSCSNKYYLGKYFYSINELDKSFSNFEQYIKAITSIQYTQKQLYTVSSAYNFLGLIALDQNQPWIAEKHAKKALTYASYKWARKGVDNSYKEEILAENILGKTHLELGQLEEAKKHSDNSMKMYIDKYKDSSITFIDLWTTRGEIMWQLGILDRAHRNFQVANQIQLKYVAKVLPNLGELAKENFYYRISSNTNLYYAFCVDLLKNTNSHLKQTKLLKEILRIRINTKGKILSESNKVKEYVQKSNDPEIKQVYDLWKAKRDELSLKSGNGYSERELNSLRVAINDYEEELTQILKANGIRFETKMVKVGDIPGRLEEDAVAIEVIRLPSYSPLKKLSKKELKAYKENDSLRIPSRLSFDQPSYMYISLNSKSKMEYKVIEDGFAMENANYKNYRNMIQFKLDDKKSYNNYFEQIETWLEGSKTLYFSGDGVYNQLNLAILMNPRTNKYLVENYSIFNINNLDEIEGRSRINIEITSATLIGRPAYSFTVVINEDTNAVYIGERGIDEFHSKSISDLPGTEKEINAINHTLENKEIKIDTYLKADATEQVIKEHPSTSILHISTHGFFVKEKTGEHTNPMMRSGLLMAGVSDFDGDSDEDGILTAYEASNIDLKNTQLVVLSACETGLGEIKNGEGVYGLQRAFQIAGVQYVLMSMWKVDDAATMKLMTTFYSKLAETNDVSKSFQFAQLELKKEYNSVYYWGAFKLIGQ